MSIYDREYIRVGPRSSSGLGSLRFISFNSWIIIINILVFVADLVTSPYAIPVAVDGTVPGKGQVVENILRDQLANPIPEVVPMIVRDQHGNLFPDPQG